MATKMRDDAEALLKKLILYDYTLKVQDKEIQVHKFILASASDYFRPIVCGSTSWSTTDCVELKEVKAELMSKLIQFIYTGDKSLISNDLKEILNLAVYFKMPKVIKQCVDQLMNAITTTNLFDLLETFKSLSLKEAVEEMTQIIRNNILTHAQFYNPIDITLAGLELILEEKEWLHFDSHGFLLMVRWLDADFANRKVHAEHFLCSLKYHLMTPENITEIMEMEEYRRMKGTWKKLIQKADAYHKLPSHQKVFFDSIKEKPAGSKSLIAINTKHFSEAPFKGLSGFFTLRQLEGKDSWQVCIPLVTPVFTGTVPFVVEVNNFLIMCSEFGKHQQWQVFDPTTQACSKMANLSRPRDAFAMVPHGRSLYVLGGSVGSAASKVITDTIEEYSFDTGKWKSTKKLQVPVKNHSVCVLNGCIYVSGGEMPREEGSLATVVSSRLDCLNLATGKWETKAAMLRPNTNHKMCVMKVEGKDTIIVIERDMGIQFYDPSSDQWSTCDFTVRKHNLNDFAVACKSYKWNRTSRIVVEGNTVYFLNLTGVEMNYYNKLDQTTQYTAADTLCLKWVVAEKKRDEIHQYTLPGFLIYQKGEEHLGRRTAISGYTCIAATPPVPNNIYALLAFPDPLRYKKSCYWGEDPNTKYSICQHTPK